MSPRHTLHYLNFYQLGMKSIIKLSLWFDVLVQHWSWIQTRLSPFTVLLLLECVFPTQLDWKQHFSLYDQEMCVSCSTFEIFIWPSLISEMWFIKLCVLISAMSRKFVRQNKHVYIIGLRPHEGIKSGVTILKTKRLCNNL